MVLLGDCRPVGNASCELVQYLRTAWLHESAVPTVGLRTTTTHIYTIHTLVQQECGPKNKLLIIIAQGRRRPRPPTNPRSRNEAEGSKVLMSELFIYTFIGCSCFTVSMINVNKIIRAHSISFEAITKQKPFGSGAPLGPLGEHWEAYSGPCRHSRWILGAE